MMTTGRHGTGAHTEGALLDPCALRAAIVQMKNRDRSPFEQTIYDFLRVVESDLERLRSVNADMLAALSIEPVLTEGQRKTLTEGYGVLLGQEDVFNLGWRTGLAAARAAILKARGDSQ